MRQESPGGRSWCNPQAGNVRLTLVGSVAYLDGSVASYQQKKAIERLTASLPRVSKVVNRLRVVPCARRPDPAIQADLIAALREEPALPDQGIDVRVSDGVVELLGTVPDASARTSAEAVAWSIWGVQHVVNRLLMGEKAPQEGDLSPGLEGEITPLRGRR